MAVQQNAAKSAPRKSKKRKPPAPKQEPREPAKRKNEPMSILNVLRWALAITIALILVSSSLAANMWPSVLAMLEGNMNAGLLFDACLRLGAVVALVMIPMKIEKAGLIGGAIWLLVLVLFICANLFRATETAANLHTTMYAGVNAKNERKATLERNIAEAKGELAKIPENLPQVSQQAVDAAQTAVNLAITNKESECKRGPQGKQEGPLCRDSGKDVAAKQEKLQKLLADRAPSARKEELEKKASDWKTELDSIGWTPHEVEPVAERFAPIVARIVNLGQDPEKEFSKQLSTFYALITEILAAIAWPLGASVLPKAKPRVEEDEERRGIFLTLRSFAKNLSDFPKISDNRASKVGAMVGDDEPVMVGDLDVRNLFDALFERAPSERIRSSRVNELVKQHCAKLGIEPPSPKAFSPKFQLFAQYDRSGGYPVYLGIKEKRPALKLVK